MGKDDGRDTSQEVQRRATLEGTARLKAMETYMLILKVSGQHKIRREVRILSAALQGGCDMIDSLLMGW